MADLNDIFRGDDRNYNLIFKDADGVAIDITGWTIFVTVKEKINDSDDDAKIAIEATITNAVGGLATFSFTDVQTYELNGDYYYDVQIKKADGAIFTVTSGRIKIKRDITRRTV